MHTVYAQRASNTLRMRCQLASFSQILTKVGRTTTHWSYFSFFYARTVRRVCVTRPLPCIYQSLLQTPHQSLIVNFKLTLEQICQNE